VEELRIARAVVQQREEVQHCIKPRLATRAFSSLDLVASHAGKLRLGVSTSSPRWPHGGFMKAGVFQPEADAIGQHK
jgi:hypothetical protein